MKTTYGLLIFLLALFTTSCQIFIPSIADYDQLIAHAELDPSAVSTALISRAFFEREDAGQRLTESIQYEYTLAKLIENDPLRLGPLTTAVLDRNQLSLIGHVARGRFYDYLESDYALVDREWTERIIAWMTSERAGTQASPYRAMSVEDAKLLLRTWGFRVLGGSYYLNASNTMFFVVYADKGGDVTQWHFDFSESNWAIQKHAIALNSENAEKFGEQRDHFSMMYLVALEDSFAGMFLGSRAYEQEDFQTAADYYRNAAGLDNARAYFCLARVSADHASRQVPNTSYRRQLLSQMRNSYESAVDVGFDDAMFELAQIYLSGLFSSEVFPRGIGLLERATELGNENAAILLALHYKNGDLVPLDYDRSEDLLHREAKKGSKSARYEYFQLLADPASGKDVNETAINWLRDLAKDNVHAMLTIGAVYARGEYLEQNYRRAAAWYRKAASAGGEDPEIINEIAWTLTVSGHKPLRNPRYALRLMERMMNGNAVARRSPVYLDTWAAAYAAIGDFDKAVSLQEESLRNAADTQETEAVTNILKEHLEAFKRRTSIIDSIP